MISSEPSTPVRRGSSMLDHPLGVKPYGALLFGSSKPARGCGDLSRLPDDVLLRVLGLLPAPALARLATVCKGLYCYASHNELWRAFVLQELEGDFTFQQTWKATYAAAKSRSRLGSSSSAHKPPLRVEGVYSDLLYHAFHCATAPIRADWLAASSVERRAGLSRDAFQREYEIPNRPVILTDVVTQWPAFRKWTPRYLRKAYGARKAVVGDYAMAFDDFLAYAHSSRDDMPLYLFDKHFASSAPQLAKDYEVPTVFGEDLFSVLGPDRPDHRWLIMGPERSGSSFHKDPNATSAWNAVVTGSKKWVLFPPHATPPGVHPSADGADVACPLSLIEWFLGFYSEAAEEGSPAVECVVRAGELLFVPRGWWHMALNLEECIAVTHNFASSVNLPHVLRHLATGSPELISGCRPARRRTLHARLVAALQRRCPEVLLAAQREAAAGSRKRKPSELSQCFEKEADSTKRTAFKFGFGT